MFAAIRFRISAMPVLTTGIVAKPKRPHSRLCVTTTCLLAVFACRLAAGQCCRNNQEWIAFKQSCGLNMGLAYNVWVSQGAPCPARSAGSSNNDNGAAQRAQAAAAEAAAAAQRQRDAELEQQRIEADHKRRMEEIAKQARFDQDKQEALGQLKGGSGETNFDADSGLKGVNPTDLGLKTMPERHYTFAGNGLIGGTTWTLYASRKPGEPEQRMCEVIKQQSELAGSHYDSGVDCKRYQFVLGIAGSVDPFTDLSNRVAFDDLTNGQFSAHAQGLYDKLRGKRFDELGCHSNGAMICLAALENQDIQAVHVVLYGPQVTRESLEMWNKLVQDGRVKSVKVYLNENDPVPGASIAYADYKKNQIAGAAAVSSNPSVDTLARIGTQTTAGAVSELPLFQIDSLKRTINESSPRLEVQTFPCKLDRTSLGCHELTMYNSKVNCTGRSSGKAVPGTELHGKDDLREPPLPCGALGANP